jgi:hypothetical protein
MHFVTNILQGGNHFCYVVLYISRAGELVVELTLLT